MSVCVRKMRSKEGEKKERDGEAAEKEDRRFNNSQTPASFRIESVGKLDPCVLHTWHVIHSGWLAHKLCVISVHLHLCRSLHKDEGSSANSQTWISIRGAM